MNYFDNHIHTNFSPDSEMSIASLFETANKLNIKGITITDHLDLKAPDRDLVYFFDVKKREEVIKQELPKLNNIEVLQGVEIGLQPNNIKESKEFLSKHNFDTVIASIHFIDNLDPYWGSFYVGKNSFEAYSRTLETIYNTAIEFNDFDILGHFDYVTRYSPYPHNERDITMERFGDYIDPILKFLVNNGKALEINTKTYQNHNGFTPTLDITILKRLKELGAEAISLGSDAHNRSRVGENFNRFAEIAKSCNFKYLVYYKERKPYYYPIEK